jgi:hypothetical protein
MLHHSMIVYMSSNIYYMFSFRCNLQNFHNHNQYHCLVWANACKQSPTPPTQLDYCVEQYVMRQRLKLYRVIDITDIIVNDISSICIIFAIFIIMDDIYVSQSLSIYLKLSLFTIDDWQILTITLLNRQYKYLCWAFVAVTRMIIQLTT